MIQIPAPTPLRFSWVFFFIFFTANLFLSLPGPSLDQRAWVICLGLFVPFLIAFFLSPKKQRSPDPYTGNFHLEFQFPVWTWILLVSIGLFFRFERLGDADWWSGGDDSFMTRYILDLDQHFTFRPFETLGQDPSFLTYLGWFFYKLTGSTLISTQLVPASVSFATLLVMYLAVRQFFSRSLSLTLLALVSMGFWPLWISRPFLPGVVLPLWESLVVFALGRFLNGGPGPRTRQAVLLGFVAGLGPYVFFSWMVLWVWLGLIFLLHITDPAREKNSIGRPFLAGFFPPLIPFLIAAARTGYGGHILAVGVWDHFSFLDQTWTIVDYFKILFWKDATWTGKYLGDGFLNPIQDTLFLFGLMSLFQDPRSPLPKRLLWLFGLSLLPGLLSHDLESHRILLSLIPTFLIVTLGLQSLLSTTPRALKKWAWILVLVLSCGWDIQKFRVWDRANSSPYEFKTAYQKLKGLSDTLGPGLIFSEMTPYTYDHSLNVTVYPFNSALNPALDPEKAGWTAIFTDWHYVPHLLARFPRSQWIDPTSDPTKKSRHRLGYLDLTSADRSTFLQWRAYYLKVQRIDLETLDSPTGKPHTKVLEDLIDLYPQVPADPFLRSHYFEKLLYEFSWEEAFYPRNGFSDWAKLQPLFKDSFESSVKDLVLCEKYGRLFASQGNKREAYRAFRLALRIDPKNSFLKAELNQLNYGPLLKDD